MLQREHSAILLTYIKQPFVIKIFILSIFECPFYTGFTVEAKGTDVKRHAETVPDTEKVQLEKQDFDDVIVIADMDEDARSEVLEKISGSHKDSEKILITFSPAGYQTWAAGFKIRN